MKKSDLIEILAAKQDHRPTADIEAAVRALLEPLSTTLASGERLEIRGFGRFSRHRRAPRLGRVGGAARHIPSALLAGQGTARARQ